MGQNFQALGAIDLGHEVGEGELGVLRAHVLGNPEPHVVARHQVAIALASERRRMTQLFERALGGNIERPVDINQRAVEVKEDRLEFASGQLTNL